MRTFTVSPLYYAEPQEDWQKQPSSLTPKACLFTSLVKHCRSEQNNKERARDDATHNNQYQIRQQQLDPQHTTTSSFRKGKENALLRNIRIVSRSRRVIRMRTKTRHIQISLKADAYPTRGPSKLVSELLSPCFSSYGRTTPPLTNEFDETADLRGPSNTAEFLRSWENMSGRLEKSESYTSLVIPVSSKICFIVFYSFSNM